MDDIKSKAEILSLYYQSFKFPNYFGFNWDALTDFLCYLDDWLVEKRIVTQLSQALYPACSSGFKLINFASL